MMYDCVTTIARGFAESAEERSIEEIIKASFCLWYKKKGRGWSVEGDI